MFKLLIILTTVTQSVQCSPFLPNLSFAKNAALSIRGGYFDYSKSNQYTKGPFQTWTFDTICEKMVWTESPDLNWDVSCSTDEKILLEPGESELLVIGITATDANATDDSESKSKEESSQTTTLPELPYQAKQIDENLNGLLQKFLMDNLNIFKNGAILGSSTATLNVPQTLEDGSIMIKKIVFLGLGKGVGKDMNATGRKVGNVIAQKCSSEKGITSCSILLPEKNARAMSVSELTASFVSSLYSDNRFRSDNKKKFNCEKLNKVSIIIDKDSGINANNHGSTSDDLQSEIEKEIIKGSAIAKGIYLTKDIVNSPHNVLNSRSLANTAIKIAKESRGRIKCKILEKDDCEKRGMGAFLGVARGSETTPKFIHLTYSPKKRTKAIKKIGIVGKGLLMDTGGYNIKTRMMELMKFDCGGAAAVLGAARAIALLAPEDVEVHIVVAACENMISDRAYVPGDILTASNGVTIEVGNTDAEGRLTMADALVYLDKEIECERIIELSTLTGACMVALGNKIAGVWTSDENLAIELEKASKSTGDKLWRMPLEKEYNDLLKSKIADINNMGSSSYGGSIVAALFLHNFVAKEKPFAHVDMAGPVWNMKTGATGYGAKLVTEWICSQIGSK